jgi:hypothetical protein
MSTTLFSVASELASKAESVTIRLVKFDGQRYLIVEPVANDAKADPGLSEPFSIKYDEDETEPEIVRAFEEWVSARAELFDAAKAQVESMKSRSALAKGKSGLPTEKREGSESKNMDNPSQPESPSSMFDNDEDD